MRAMRVASIVFLAGIFALILYTGWERHEPNRFEAAFNPGGRVTLDLSAGGYKVRGTSENAVRVEIDSGDTADVHCRMQVNGGNAKVQIEGPSNNFQAVIYVPQRTDLTVDQTIGDLDISNVEGNNSLALDIGRIHIDIPNDVPPPSFDGSVLLGGLRALNWNVNKGGFFRSYYVRSAGPYSIRAQVDIGDLETSRSGSSVGDSHPQKPGDAGEDAGSDNDSQ